MITTGQCYCGSLKYEIAAQAEAAFQCHCRECQYITGGNPNIVMAFSKDSFRYIEGNPKKFARADLDTPVSAMLRIGENEPYSFLLESVEGGESKGRYSILGLKPDLIWRCYGDKAEINYNPSKSLSKFSLDSKSTLKSIRSLLKSSKINLPEYLPPMASGLVGYLGFDTIKFSMNTQRSFPSSILLVIPE